jgi:RNA polymerase sigma factor (sigma-70 family)
MTQGKYLEMKRDSRPRQAAERQEHRNQDGCHREQSLSAAAGKFNGANAYRVFGSHTRKGCADELCALDEALSALAQKDPRRAQVIELRFFASLSVDETAEILSVSQQTVMRDWKLTRAWLGVELRR